MRRQMVTKIIIIIIIIMIKLIIIITAICCYLLSCFVFGSKGERYRKTMVYIHFEYYKYFFIFNATW